QCEQSALGFIEYVADCAGFLDRAAFFVRATCLQIRGVVHVPLEIGTIQHGHPQHHQFAILQIQTEIGANPTQQGVPALRERGTSQQYSVNADQFTIGPTGLHSRKQFRRNRGIPFAVSPRRDPHITHTALLARKLVAGTYRATVGFCAAARKTVSGYAAITAGNRHALPCALTKRVIAYCIRHDESRASGLTLSRSMPSRSRSSPKRK